MQLLFAAAAVATTVLAGSRAAAQNVLVNGDFESNPPAGFGNNIGYPIALWVLGTGQSSNVVKVDGPGGFNYGSLGPESDASAPGAGIAQHYLDIAGGQNTFYQTFTPQCSGAVEFGGYFSTRDNSPGTATVTVRNGVGIGGSVVGTTNTVSLPGGNSRLDPWTLVSYSVPITAFQTYSFVVDMTNNLNFDNGFVTYRTNCGTPNPCCPPWNTSQLAEMLYYVGTGGIAAPYTLEFQPTAAFVSQMQSYIDYVYTLPPNHSSMITIQFRLHDGGIGAAPVTGAQLGASHYVTWTAPNLGLSPPPTFFSGPAETQDVNRWYLIHTGIYLEGGVTFFPAECNDNDVAVRVQVQKRGGLVGPGVLQIRTRDGRIVERPLP